MRHNVYAVMLVSCLVPMAAHAAPASCDLLDKQMLAALDLGDADARAEPKPVAATGQAPAQRLDMFTFTPRVGAAATVNVMRIPLAAGTPPGKPVCTEKLDAKVGIASCNVIARDSIVTVSLVSRRAGFETLSATFRSHFERLFRPDSARR
jgi:hypothetical protein